MAFAVVAPHAYAMWAAVVGGGRGQRSVGSKGEIATGARQGERLITYAVLQRAGSSPNC